MTPEPRLTSLCVSRAGQRMSVVQQAEMLASADAPRPVATLSRYLLPFARAGCNGTVRASGNEAAASGVEASYRQKWGDDLQFARGEAGSTPEGAPFGAVMPSEGSRRHSP